MKKRLLSLFLVFLLSISAVQVFATKESGNESNVDITKVNLAPHCDFDVPLNEDRPGRFHYAYGCSISWSDQGANGTSGSIRIVQNVANGYGYGYVQLPYKETIGETFDIYLWARSQSGEYELKHQPFIGGSASNQIQTEIINEEWRKLHFTYTNEGTVDSNEELRLCSFFAGGGYLGVAGTVYYLDEIEIYARGDCDYTEYYTGMINEDYYPEDTGFDDPQPVGNADFYDMKSHWAEETIDVLAKSGIVNGFGDGTYGPEKGVTRAEFIKMTMTVLNYDNVDYNGEFADIKGTEWYADFVANANDLGYINDAMIKDRAFLPNAPITREEAASILAKVATVRAKDDKASVSAFVDDGEISEWAKNDVYTSAGYGLINGYPDGSFGPTKNITRAEAASLIYRAIELSGRITYYVDGKRGNDKNDGTKNKPFKTVEKARDYIQPLLEKMQSHIFVYIAGGEYKLTNSIDFSTKDSGQNGYYVFYTSMDKDNKPTFTGGEEFGEFELYNKDLNIYRTQIGKNRIIGEIFVDEVRADLARTEYLSSTTMKTKTAVYSQDISESFLVNPKKIEAEYSLVCDNKDLLELKRPQDVRLVFNDQWCSQPMQVHDIFETDDGKVQLKTDSDTWRNLFANGIALSTWPEYYENALEILDTEGEYYYNVSDGFLYYKPRKFQNPAKMIATIPVYSDAIMVCGDKVEDKVHNIRFENLSFKYFTWPWENENFAKHYQPDYAGWKDYKSDHPLKGAAADAPLTIGDAAYVDVVNCEFAHLGGAALKYDRIFQNCNIIGNHIYDIGADGILVGSYYSQNKLTFGLRANYVNPRDYKYYQCHNLVKNNLVHDVAMTHRQAHGICVGFLKKSTVTHNEVYNAGYKGIHVGGGLDGYLEDGAGIRDLEVSNNYVHETGTYRNYDSGSIYLAGLSGGNPDNYNQIKNNYLVNQYVSFGTLYFDSGTRYYEITGNVSDLTDVIEDKGTAPSEVFIWATNVRKNYIHDNWSATDKILFNQKDNIYKKSEVYPDANWPEEAQAVVDNAGLEPQYLEKFKDEGIQRIRRMSPDQFKLTKGETAKLDIKAYKREFVKKDVEQDVSYRDFNFYSSNENVATVNEKGEITARGSGMCYVFAEHLEGTIARRVVTEIICDDQVAAIQAPASKINAIYGDVTKVIALGITDNFSMVELAPTKAEIDDPSIVSIDSDGTVKAIGEGQTEVTLTFESGRAKLEHKCIIKSVRYNNEEETLAYAKKHSRALKEGDRFFNPTNWTGTGTAKVSENGGIDVNKANPMWTTFQIKNELLSFDLEVSNPTSWPGFMFNGKSHDATTSGDNDGEFYLICISEPMVELQRFSNGGENHQNVIFGYEALNPIGGIGYPNRIGNEIMGGELYRVNDVTYSITAGAIDEPGGTRLIFILNGKPIYDYLDKDGISGGGFWGVYNSSGTFNFKPFTDQRFLGYED